jgi:hypothetical protein
VFKQLANPATVSAASIKGLQRYSALNVQAIAKLGTVEFRQMENDGTELLSRQVAFINFVMRLKDTAMSMYRKGLVGEKLFEWAKKSNKQELLDRIGFPLPTEGWDYSESLMVASLLVPFTQERPLKETFVDSYFAPFYGMHPKFR